MSQLSPNIRIYLFYEFWQILNLSRNKGSISCINLLIREGFNKKHLLLADMSATTIIQFKQRVQLTCYRYTPALAYTSGRLYIHANRVYVREQHVQSMKQSFISQKCRPFFQTKRSGGGCFYAPIYACSDVGRPHNRLLSFMRKAYIYICNFFPKSF